jgi:dolichol-phosphate mannosyltransferase
MLSVVVPVYNEADGLPAFHKALLEAIHQAVEDSYELIYCDDGSTDDSSKVIQNWHRDNSRIKLLRLTRNFGKEIAITAGIHEAKGDAVMTIDADGQHPVDLIPEFVRRWKDGAKVVIGVRESNQNEGVVKRLGSKLFYKTYNRFAGMDIVPGSSDFRLIDRSVQQEFVRITERSRMTRALIDWLGYQRDYIKFKANPRLTGEAGYSFKKLFKLFIDSIVSMSKSPLYLSAYIGAIVLPVSTLLGLGMLINAGVGDPLNLHATGGAYILVLVLFLVGILLVSQGIIGLYLSHIHAETQNRPLYIIDKHKSAGLDEE